MEKAGHFLHPTAMAMGQTTMVFLLSQHAVERSIRAFAGDAQVHNPAPKRGMMAA